MSKLFCKVHPVLEHKRVSLRKVARLPFWTDHGDLARRAGLVFYSYFDCLQQITAKSSSRFVFVLRGCRVRPPRYLLIVQYGTERAQRVE